MEMELLLLLNDVFKILHCLGHMAHSALNGKSVTLYASMIVQHAQVVVVEILKANFSGLSQGHYVVAKFYDSMYVDDDEFNVNPFLAAAEDYSHETVAYQTLSDFQGTQISQYYGSYSPKTPSSRGSAVSDLF